MRSGVLRFLTLFFLLLYLSLHFLFGRLVGRFLARVAERIYMRHSAAACGDCVAGEVAWRHLGPSSDGSAWRTHRGEHGEDKVGAVVRLRRHIVLLVFGQVPPLVRCTSSLADMV